MRPAFLCTKHKALLAFLPEHVIHLYSVATNTGQSFYADEQWQEALPHIGCAFEMAEIILTTGAINSDCAIQQYYQATVALAQALIQLGRIDACKEIYQAAINRLGKESEVLAGRDVAIQLQINSLIRELQQLGDYRATAIA